MDPTEFFPTHAPHGLTGTGVHAWPDKFDQLSKGVIRENILTGIFNSLMLAQAKNRQTILVKRLEEMFIRTPPTIHSRLNVLENHSDFLSYCKNNCRYNNFFKRNSLSIEWLNQYTGTLQLLVSYM